MTVYGITPYGTDVYGLSLPPAYMVDPFTAESIDYGTIQLNWTTPSGVIFRYRLLTNRYGFPVNENDGTVVMDSINYPGNSYRDTQIIPGSFHYYSFFCLVDLENNIWVNGGNTACLAIQDYHSAGDMWEKMPEHFKTMPDTGGEITGDASGLPYVAQFLNVIGWGMDQIHTQYGFLARTLNDPMTCSLPDLWRLAAELGLSFTPAIPAYTVRKAVQNWAHICRERGTLLGLKNELDLRTGWGADLQLGPNILLTNDQSLFLSEVFQPYTPQRYYLVQELVWCWLGHGRNDPNDWVKNQWLGNGYWYRNVSPCQGIAPPGDGTSNANWQCVVDTNDFVFGLVDQSSGNPSSWEAVAPSAANFLLPHGGLTQGIGVPNLTATGRAWNSLRCINTGGAAQNIMLRSLSRATSAIATMPDPSFEVGFTIPPTNTICEVDWIPDYWPQAMFQMPGFPGQRHCPEQYNAAAFWTPSNCTLTRSTSAAHTGVWGIIMQPDPALAAESWQVDSPWVSVQNGESTTASIWVKAPFGLNGVVPPPVTNLLPDPGFVNGVGGFTGSNCTLANTTAKLLAGTTNALAVSVNSEFDVFEATQFSVNGPIMTVTASTAYTASLWISSPVAPSYATTTGAVSCSFSVNWINAAGAVIGSSLVGHNTELANTYQQFAANITSPPLAVSAQFALTGGSYALQDGVAWEIAQTYMQAGTPVVPGVPVTPLLKFGQQSDGSIPLQLTGTPTTLAAGVWTQLSVSCNAPADGYAWLELDVNGGITADTLYFDDAAITTGASLPQYPDPSVVISNGIPVPWLRPSETWNAATRYDTQDLVLYEGQAFQALRASTGIIPPQNNCASAEWEPLSENQRIRLAVSGYTSQNQSLSTTQQYATVPYVEWFDQNGNPICRLLARNGTTGGIVGKPPNLVFDSFTGPSRVINESLSTPVLGPWQASFYANEELVEPAACQRTDQAVVFSWGGNPPAPSVGTTGWSASWVTTFTPQINGLYTFSMQGNGGGSRLIVGNQLVINNWVSQLNTVTTGTIALNAGTPVEVEIDYFVPLEVFVTTYQVSVIEPFHPNWLLFPERFCSWTSDPFPCIAGYPFRMQVFPGGEKSRGQCTWYYNDEPIEVTDTVEVQEFIDGFPVLTIIDVVPERANYCRFWCEEDGDRWWGLDEGWLGRRQYFQHQYTEVTYVPAMNFSAPVPFVQVGTTQYTNTLIGRTTDDDIATWTVPTGAFAVGGYSEGSAWPLTPGMRSVALIQGVANTQVGVTFRSGPASGQTQGIVFRYSANNSYWRCGRSTLMKNVAGVWTTVATHTTSFSDNDRMVVVLNGSAINVYRNNNMVTPVSTATDTFNSSASLHGIIVEAT
jgi:PA14 domain-containing protein